MAKTAKAVLLQMAHCRVLFWLPAHALRGLIPGSRKMCLLCVYFVYSSISRGFFRAGRGGWQIFAEMYWGASTKYKIPIHADEKHNLSPVVSNFITPVCSEVFYRLFKFVYSSEQNRTRSFFCWKTPNLILHLRVVGAQKQYLKNLNID